MKIQIPDFSTARVLVVGDIMLDRYWHGGTSRISPEAPVPVVHVRESEERAGGAGNVALNIAMLGGKATLIGLTGDDHEAEILENSLTAVGVDCQLARVQGLPTVTKLRVISRHQQLIRLDFEDGFGNAGGDMIVDAFRQHLESADVVVLSDYGKGALQNVGALIAMAREKSIPVLVDPKSKDFSIYQGASLITPNLTEFEAVVGSCSDEVELVEKGDELAARHQLEALLVTRGEHGMSLLRPGQEPLHLPTHAREVFDVTGAGDTVISVLAAGLAAMGDVPKAMALANLAAGIVVGKLGTASVTTAELHRGVHNLDESGQGILSEAQLLQMVQVAHDHSEKVVMTNGCFDILHAGHVSYLDQARRLGDRLIVAVNDDASVKLLKGERRPVNSLQERMEVLAALGSVDWVVPFSEETPERLICQVKPDFLVKGGDYKAEDVAGFDCVTNNGGEVRILGFKDGFSTTQTIEELSHRQ